MVNHVLSFFKFNRLVDSHNGHVREQDISLTGVMLKWVKDSFKRKGLIFNLAKRTFIIAKLFLRSMYV